MNQIDGCIICMAYNNNTIYKGDPTAAITYLKNRLIEVTKANPWIGSKIVKDKERHGKLLAMRYSKSSPPRMICLK